MLARRRYQISVNSVPWPLLSACCSRDESGGCWVNKSGGARSRHSHDILDTWLCFCTFLLHEAQVSGIEPSPRGLPYIRDMRGAPWAALTRLERGAGCPRELQLRMVEAGDIRRVADVGQWKFLSGKPVTFRERGL